MSTLTPLLNQIKLIWTSTFHPLLDDSELKIQMSILNVAKDMETHFLHVRDVSSVKNGVGFKLFSLFSQIQFS